jgi:hypothetical protein
VRKKDYPPCPLRNQPLHGDQELLRHVVRISFQRWLASYRKGRPPVHPVRSSALAGDCSSTGHGGATDMANLVHR